VAKVEGNILLDGISGKVGDLLVFRQVGGKTIVAKAPNMRRRKLSPAQTKHLNKFQCAKEYARKQMREPEARAAYQTHACGNKAAYHVAIGDYMNSPKIEHIDTSSYNGRIDDIIKISATDDFHVTHVQVRILNTNGSLIEAGEAAPQANAADWTYTVKVASAPIAGQRVQVAAMDRPGNVAKAEVEIG